jgi:adenylate kinase
MGKEMKTFRDFIFEKLGRMRIIMLGGPGSGKSTYTEYLIKHFNITHIYPGGMLRKEVEKGSEIGKQVKSIIDRGEFVPNQIVLDLITKKVEQSPQGYVLDGWPRYMQQVEDMEKAEIGYDYAVFLDVSREEVLRRLLARGRADDTEEIINNRIELYKKETGPVVEYMRNRPGFIEVKAEGGTPEETANEIIRRIENESK